MQRTLQDTLETSGSTPAICYQLRKSIMDYTPNHKDLETIVTLLQVATIFLTPMADTTFTLQQLLGQVHQLCGNEFTMDDKDILIVLPFCGFFLKKLSGNTFSMK